MNDWFHAVLFILFETLSGRRDDRVRFLKAQVEILRKKIPGNRVVVDPGDRKKLLELGAAVGHEVEDILVLVHPKTYRHWLLEKKRGKLPKKVGRPRMDQAVREAILKLARENAFWGTKRIVGELKKLKIIISRLSVRRVL
jgi:putative transposase